MVAPDLSPHPSLGTESPAGSTTWKLIRICLSSLETRKGCQWASVIHRVRGEPRKWGQWVQAKGIIFLCGGTQRLHVVGSWNPKGVSCPRSEVVFSLLPKPATSVLEPSPLLHSDYPAGTPAKGCPPLGHSSASGAGAEQGAERGGRGLAAGCLGASRLKAKRLPASARGLRSPAAPGTSRAPLRRALRRQEVGLRGWVVRRPWLILLFPRGKS